MVIPPIIDVLFSHYQYTPSIFSLSSRLCWLLTFNIVNNGIVIVVDFECSDSTVILYYYITVRVLRYLPFGPVILIFYYFTQRETENKSIYETFITPKTVDYRKVHSKIYKKFYRLNHHFNEIIFTLEKNNIIEKEIGLLLSYSHELGICITKVLSPVRSGDLGKKYLLEKLSFLFLPGTFLVESLRLNTERYSIKEVDWK